MGPMESARAIWEVTAGLIPGQVDDKHTQRYGVTSAEWDAHGLAVFLERWHQAAAYAEYLQQLCTEGREVNWVRLDFVWP